ncbi:MAG: NUDIX hydrolase [Candidatus Nanoarchaeia archaeon]|nr:NUDIX hydrolase [Candidatus Nanoarchaeia archaeon]
MIKKPIFENKPNTEYKVGGKTIWESRSVAVVGVILAQWNKKVYTLIEKRSKNMPDSPGKWCLPCGYLDWDETGYEALIREFYEETSLYLPNYKNQLLFNNDEQPFFVNTDPSENRQNVSLSYITIFDFLEEKSLPLEILNFKNSEIDEIKWVELLDLIEYDFAFNHEERIVMAANLALEIFNDSGE